MALFKLFTRLELHRNPEVSNQFHLIRLYAPVKVPSVRTTLLHATKSKTPLRESPEAFMSVYKVLVKLGTVYLLLTSFWIEPCSSAIDTSAIAHSSSACLPSIWTQSAQQSDSGEEAQSNWSLAGLPNPAKWNHNSGMTMAPILLLWFFI